MTAWSRKRVGAGGRTCGRFLRSDRGAAAVEMALIVAVMTAPLANVIDLANYTFHKVQVELAAEAGVQAIRGMCSPVQVPITQYCTTNLVTRITSAVQSTTLGAAATVQAGSPVEGYYCVNSSTRTLQLVGSTGTIGAPPPVPTDFTCTITGSAAAAPGDYVQVTATYTYKALFPNLTLTSLLPSPIIRTAWYRAR